MPLHSALLLPLFAVVLLSAEPGASAVTLFEQKQFPEAQAAFESRVASNPNDAEAHAYLGRLAMARQELEPALTHLSRAVELKPSSAEYQFLYGSICVQQAGKLGMSFKALGLVKRGRTAMEKAVELAPSEVGYRQGLIEFYAQAPGLAGGGLDKAYAQVEALRTVDPRAAAIAAAGLKLREKKPAEALALMEDLVRAQPDDYQALYLIGRTASESGTALDRGIVALQACLALTPPPRMVSHASVNFRLGDVLLKKGDPLAARAAFEAALQIDPAHAASKTALQHMGAAR